MKSILAIAPFQELADKEREILHNRGLDIEVKVASNDQAVDIAKSEPTKTILISRGGTAYDLKKIPERTVVEIRTTLSDILEELERVAFAGYTHIGIVTNDNIIDNIARDFVFSNMHISMRPCKTHMEIRHMVSKLCNEGADFIIGCHQAVKQAEKMHVDHEYIHSGSIAINRAIDEALRIENTRELTHFQMNRLNTIINNTREGIVIFGANHLPVYFNSIARNVLENINKHDWYTALAEQLTSVGKENIVILENMKLLMKRIILKLGDRSNELFIFQEANEIEKQERKIRLSSRQRGFYAKTHFEDIFTKSPYMRAILQRAQKFAYTDSNILIYGSTGTGKEGLAQSIHNASKRANYPFVSVNCASLPADLIESELFGYVDGAFTGARKSGKPGLFEMAHKGTIFLDEVGELPLNLQGRLLRVLQEKEVMRIGDDRIIPLDVRVVCATNRNLKQLAKEGKFRYDLYYRINVLRITLPELRQRNEDIWPLLSLYYQKFTKDDKKLQLTNKAKNILLTYDWPGNIRELKNIAEVLAFEDGLITESIVKDILEIDDDKESERTKFSLEQEQDIVLPADLSRREFEEAYIQKLLLIKSKDEVCQQLGISRVTLWRKLNEISEKK